MAYTDGDGTVHSDTLWGNAQYYYVDGEPFTDTVPSDARWNMVLQEGQKVSMTACRWDADTALGPILLTAIGDLRPLSASATPSEQCVQLVGTASR